MDPRFPRCPIRYPECVQIYHGTPANPYPMTFMQAPSFSHQVLVNYQGCPNLQGLSTVRGPFMFPVRTQIAYPVTSSVLDPYQRSFLGLNYGYCTRR